MRNARALLALAAVVLAPACAPKRTPGPHLDPEAKVEGAPYRGHYVTLPTGLRIVTFEVEGAPATKITVSYGLAGIEVPAGKEGLHLLARTAANRGGMVRGGFRVMERLFAAGAYFSSSADLEELRFDVKLRPERLEEILAVEADLARDPVAGLEDREIESYREVLASSLERDTDGVADRVARLAAKVLPGTPYARPGATPASVRSLTPDDVRGFLGKVIRPERAVVVVVGPRKAEETARLVGKAFGEGDPARRVAPLAPPAPPPRPASIPADLETVAGKGDRAELWLAWAVPGVRDRGSAQGVAAAELVEKHLQWRAGGKDLDPQVRWVSAWYVEHERAGLLVVRAALNEGADAGAVRQVLALSAAEVGAERERWKVVTATRLGQTLTYEAFARLEDGRIAGVPELVRALDQPDALSEWNRQAGLMPAQLQGYLGRHIVADRAAALLVSKSTEAKRPEEPGQVLRGWTRGTSLLSTSAPGASEAAKLLRPPGLDGGLRRVLSNGLTVVVLPRGRFPTVEVSLHVTTDVDTPRNRAERDVAAAAAAWDMHGRSCDPTEARIVDGGLEIRDHVPAARVLAALQGIACWTRADPNRWQVDAWLEDAKRAESRKDSRPWLVNAMMEEALSAPPGKPVALEPVYERVDRAEAAGRFLRWFRPDRATLVVAGRIDEPEAMLNDLTDLFGGWEAEGQPLDEPPAPPTTASRALLLDYPGSKSAWMLVLLRLPTLPERDDAALRVLRAHLAERVVEVSMPVAGEGFVSIVDGTHLAYTVVGFDGKPEHVPAVLEATLTDLENLARKPLDGPSLDYARWWAVLDAAFAYDRFEGAARGVQRLASHRLPPGALEGAGERLAGVTPETLRTFAASVTGHRLVVVAGDAKSLLPELRRIGLEPQVVEVVKKEPAKK